MQRLKDRIINRASLVIMLVVALLAALLSWGQEIFYDLSMDDIEWEVIYDSSDKVEPDSTSLKSPWLKNAQGKCDISVASDSLSKNEWQLNIFTPTDATDGAAYYYQDSENDRWYDVVNLKGWTVEVRLRVVSVGVRPQILKINDGVHEEILEFYGDRMVLGKSGKFYYCNLRDRYHTLRIVGVGQHISVYTENSLLFEESFSSPATEKKIILFGDDAYDQDGWGGEVYWKYIKYTTEMAFFPQVHYGFGFINFFRLNLIGAVLFILITIFYEYEEYRRYLYYYVAKTVELLPEIFITMFILGLIVSAVMWSPDARNRAEVWGDWVFLFLVIGVIAWLVRSCITEKGDT